MKLKYAIKKLFSFPIHTFLLAAFPVIFLYAHNIEETSIAMTFKPLLVVLVGVAIFLFFGKLIFKNWLKSGLLLSLGVLIFFSHGHLHNLIGSLKYQVWMFELGTDDSLFGIWAVLAISVFFLLLRTKIDLKKLTGFLNFVSLILVLYLLVTSLSHEIGRLFSSPEPSETTNIQATGKGIGYKPDIYYIILDRYDANRTLQENYGFDNNPFTDFLEEKGFYVAYDSFSNYPRTYLSLATSLNMVYLEPPLVGGPDPLIADQALAKFLKSQGYLYLHIGSWTRATRTSPLADINYVDTELYLDLDEFTLRLVETTAFAPIARRLSFGPNISDYHTYHRTRAIYQFNRLEEISKNQRSPKFIFMHVLLPHDPYVFGPNCEPEDPEGSTVEQYLSNLSCTNKLTKEAVETVLANSLQPPVIVIQGDEGQYAFKYPYVKGTDYFQINPKTLQERARILNSYYLPGVGSDKILYPSITPVNSFRLILNVYFGAELELFQDRSFIFQNDKNNPWYYDLDGPVEFIDVTDKVR
ncbi:MAG: hypothetical protein XU08_C0001G0010 [candidate division WWE3 bacterium CSP1-7]|uniref:Sulfatase N-terminal domain-containing protein n=1 Tax=candidate division WWE3 bacterium CSP1-7 TaxID=1576480 RepID=A0A0T5ZXR4_UNCKA|nr:MAG: hypothetical protein XU08_C0001G0010 [candidate division WWE3 bacterium CSP1-7]HJZ05577.1 sulfatase-like hydrolase/transferase [Patescibacteria group bacterium]